MSKPIVYTYKTAKNRIEELEAEIVRLKEENAALRKAINTDLEAEKRTIDELLHKWGYKLP